MHSRPSAHPFLAFWLPLLGYGTAVLLMSLLALGFWVRLPWLDALEQRPLVQALQVWVSPVVLGLCALCLVFQPSRPARVLAFGAYLYGVVWFALLLFIYSGGTF